MSGERENHLGQPIGTELASWVPPARPQVARLSGSWTRLERLDARLHAPDLWREFSEDREGRMWTYLPWGPFDTETEFQAAVQSAADGADRSFFAIVDRHDGVAVGMLAYLRIDPAAGSLEVGAIMLSPRAQRSRVATEAVHLLAAHAFELGYRRFEWKCDSLNDASRRAATRYGFTHEGTFRCATVYKNRNRDTAWFAITESDWRRLRGAYTEWLTAENFDETGQQRSRLSDLTRSLG
jgi:RimJ/RimL family protein N-acetyltransferase